MSIPKRKPVVGETLYSLNIGNRARRNIPQILTPVIVTSVGKKYFTVRLKEYNKDIAKFTLEDWRQHTIYCQDYALFETEQEWLDKKESENIRNKIWKSFEYGHNNLNVDLEDLRKINGIIHQYEPATAV
jgi:hypothetical protein